MTNVNANFYLWQSSDNSIKSWNPTYRPLPNNHYLLNKALGDNQIPDYIDLDVVLSQNKFGQFPVAKRISTLYNIPLISIEHCLPPPNWSEDQLIAVKKMKGDINLFISDFSRKAWGWNETEADVIIHGIDTHTFSPLKHLKRDSVLLSIANLWTERDWCLNFTGWQRITKGLPVRVVGDTPGLSRPAKDLNELVHFYRTSQIYLNTTTYSPIPTVVLEAMSCECVPVALNNSMLPEVIEHGDNGYLANSEAEARKYCEYLLENPNVCRTMGERARQTIVEKFNLENFVQNWNRILYESIGETFED
jgi:glycosyltransferase involved in cell wall biosynthesis